MAARMRLGLPLSLAHAEPAEKHLPHVGHQARHVEAFAANVEIALVAVRGAAVELPPGEQLAAALEQGADMGLVLGHRLEREPSRRAEPGTQRRAERARTDAGFLPAAGEAGRQFHALADPQGADTFGAIKLV